MACMIQVRVDDDLKMKSDALFKELGIDTTAAIRMFLTKAVAYKGIPFMIRQEEQASPYSPMTEDQMLEKLSDSRRRLVYGECMSSADMVAEMRSKYESKMK